MRIYFCFIYCLFCRNIIFRWSSERLKVGNFIIKTTDGDKSRLSLQSLDFITHLGYFITRWIASGHAPVSNMFEFTTAFGMMVVGAFILIFYLIPNTITRTVCIADCDYHHCLCKYVPEGNYTIYSSVEKLLVNSPCYYCCTW